jgi:eukaryotic-like serine/threonine-protein kinase
MVSRNYVPPLAEHVRHRASWPNGLGALAIFDMLGSPPMERDVRVGQLIAGKYRVEKMLGRGGMGVVMAALHEQLNQRVALKFLTDDAYQQPEAVTRFLREARAAVQIQSEHVARVMDVGTLDSGAPYMVMEYLRGLDLKEVSTRRGPLPVSEAVDFLLQACDAVAEAHSLGIVHRDLKPSNLFLTERPDGTPMVKVLDFGISKALHGSRGGDTSQHQMTASAAIMGSPQYMSPEQIRSSKNVDARADVWALGTILHELISGTPTYVADTVPGLLAMIVADSPPPLTASRPDAPAEIEAAIFRCLEKDRDRRFANVAELARSIERFASPESRPLVRRIARVLGDSSRDLRAPTSFAPSSPPMRETSVQTHSTWARTGRSSDRAPVPVYARPSVQLGAGVGVVAVSLVAWFLVIRRAPDAVVATPALSTSALTTPAAPPGPATGAAPPASVTTVTGSSHTLPPAIGGVRPVRDVEPPTKPLQDRPIERAPEAPPAEDDDDPRAAHNFRDDGIAYPSANAKKKDLAAASRKPRLATKPVRTPAATDPAPSADDAPTAPSKKSNTLDLFNDTK